MKDAIEKINRNAYWVFALSVLKIWDFIKPYVYKMDVSKYYENYDWVGLILYLAVVYLLFRVMRRCNKIESEADGVNKRADEINRKADEINRKADAINLISSMRNEYFYIKQFNDQRFLKLPDESMDTYVSRIPSGTYKEYLENEYNNAVQILCKRLDIKPSESQAILAKLYEK